MTAREGSPYRAIVQAALAAALMGLVLSGCASRRDAAPVVDRSRPPSMSHRSAPAPTESRAAKPAAEGYYIVKRGDTLYSIALEHGADYREVAQWNGLDDPTRIYAGQQLRVTEPAPARGVEVGTIRNPNRVEARPLGAPDPARKEPVAAATPQEAAPGTPKIAAAGAFIWPAKGKVSTAFAESRSKGIDIDGKPGDPIVAAAAGRVTYTGSGIPGLGKLVVIKHDNGYITVYAHNRDILVKEQQAVARGQKIAELGSTDADRPKLHFQIRKGSSPVDPMRYLPGS